MDDLEGLTNEQLAASIDAERGKPDWTLDDAPGDAEARRRVLDFYRTQEAAGVGAREAARRGAAYFPGVDHEAMARAYPRLTQERRLQEARSEEWGLGAKLKEWFGQGNNLPFGSVLRAAGASGYDAAVRRYQEGRPEEGDYKKIAAYERVERARKEMAESWDTGLLQAAGEVAPVGLEFAAGAPLARGAAALMGGAARAAVPSAVARAVPAAAARGLGYAAETAAMTALAPSTYLDRAVEENRRAGRPALSLEGLSKGYALGLVQMGVLRGVGALAGGALPEMGEGGRRFLSALAAQAGGGVVGSAVADVLTSSVGLDAGYGTIGQILEGKPRDALYHATLQALTFAAFAGAHYQAKPQAAPPAAPGTAAPGPEAPPAPPPAAGANAPAAPPEAPAAAPPQEVARVLKEQAAAGATRDQAAQAVQEAIIRPAQAAPEAPAGAAAPGPPEAPRARADRLAAELQAADREALEARRAADLARTNASVGLGGPGALGAAQARLQAARKRQKALARELGAARDELHREPPEAPRPPEIINPVAPNEALGGLRTGAVEVPLGPGAKARPAEVFTPEEVKALEAAPPEAVEEAATRFLKASGVALDQHGNPAEHPSPQGYDVLPAELERAVAGAGLAPEAREALLGVLKAGSAGGDEQLRRRAAAAVKALAKAHPELVGTARTAEGFLKVLRAREDLAREQRALEKMSPAEIRDEEASVLREMRDVVRDLAVRPAPVEPPPVRPQAPEALPAEAAPAGAPDAGRGAEAPGEGAAGGAAAAGAGGAAPARDVVDAQREMADAREAIHRGEGEEGGPAAGPEPAGPGRQPPGQGAAAAGAGAAPAAPGAAGTAGGARAAGGGPRRGIAGGQEEPNPARDAAIDRIADEMLKDQIGRPPAGANAPPPPRAGGKNLPPGPPEGAGASGWAQAKAQVVARLKAFYDHARFGFAELSGRMFPRTTEAAERAGAALGRFVAAGAYAREKAPEMIDKVGGPGMTPEQDRLWGAAFAEMRLRKIRSAAVEGYQKADREAREAQARADAVPEEEAASAEALGLRNAARRARERADEAERAARAVGTLVGKENSPLASEADFQKAQADPQFQAMLARWKQNMAPFMDEWYRKGAGLEPDDPIYSPTQMLQEGLPLNLKPAVRGRDQTPTTVFTRAAEGEAGPGGETAAGQARGNMVGQRVRRSVFERQATGAAEGYETSLSAMIQHSVGESLKVGAKAEALREAVASGVAVRGPAARKVDLPDGPATKEIPGVWGKGEEGPSLYVREDLYGEYRKALATDEPNRLPLLGAFNNALARATIASTVEAAYHSRNLVSMLLKPYMLRNFISSAQDVWAKDPVARSELVELARIGAGAHEKPDGAGGNLNPLNWLSRFLGVTDKVMRVAAGRAFDQMAKEGLAVDAESAKRDFVNQLGQYQIRAQNRAVAILRDTGIGPFATAGTNFWAQGIRGLAGGHGVEATSRQADLRLRAEVLGKLAGAFGAAAVANYLLWGDPLGDDRTPLGSVKLPEAFQSEGIPRTASLDLAGLAGASRGLRSVGALAFLEASRGIPGPAPKESTLDRAANDVFRGLLHPAMGPGVAFLHTAWTGKDAIGRQVAATPEEKGGSRLGHNVAAALWHANPLAETARAATTGATHAGTQAPLEETATQLLGPYGVKYRYSQGYRRPRAH